MKNICKKLSLAFLILSFFSATIVNATTIMTYSGTGFGHGDLSTVGLLQLHVRILLGIIKLDGVLEHLLC